MLEYHTSLVDLQYNCFLKSIVIVWISSLILLNIISLISYKYRMLLHILIFTRLLYPISSRGGLEQRFHSIGFQTFNEQSCETSLDWLFSSCGCIVLSQIGGDWTGKTELSLSFFVRFITLLFPWSDFLGVFIGLIQIWLVCSVWWIHLILVN